MDKKFFVDQQKKFSEVYQISIDEEILGEIVNKAAFRVLPKGEILASIGDDTSSAGLVLSGLARCYYIDQDGNDITRGFAPEGAMCMDEGFFGYPEYGTNRAPARSIASRNGSALIYVTL